MDDAAMLYWLNIGKNIAAFLVAIGVAAEFFLGWIESPIVKRIDEARQAEIAGANERAANATLETEKLKATVAWRMVTPEMVASLVGVLGAKPGSVNLRYTDGDPEAMFLAIQVSKVLEEAHWQVAPGAEKFASAIQFGIALPDSNNDSTQTLRAAFKAAQIPFSTDPIPQQGVSFNTATIPGAPILMIGSRPPLWFK